MPIYDDSLDVRLCSPDFQEDWGVVGDPTTVVLAKSRSAAATLELTVEAGSPAYQILMREDCGVRVAFRGRCEFIGHVYLRRGGVAPDAPLTLWARDEAEIFDNTLAWVIPRPLTIAAGVGVGSWYSSGSIEPEAFADSAQAFPRLFLDGGHYKWQIPWVNWTLATPSWKFFPPRMVGHFIGSLLDANPTRIGYTRGSLWSEDSEFHLLNSGAGAPFYVVDEDAAATWNPLDDAPWRASFLGMAPRFQTLREVVQVFQTWADANDERSFSLYSSGEIGAGPHEVRVGYRQNPEPYSVPLSVSAGTIVDGDWAVAAHEGSRIILGGPGEQEWRLFQERSLPERERTGRVIEVFKDATGANLTGSINNPNYEPPREYLVDNNVSDYYKSRARAYFDQQGRKALAEAAPSTTVQVELQETQDIYYGGESGYQLGQKVTLDLGWSKVTNRVDRVTISLTRDKGLTVIPQVGDLVIDADEIYAQAIRAIANRQRRENAER